MSYAIYIDPATADIVVEGNLVTVTESPTPEIYLALGLPLGSVVGDPDQGSALPGFTSGGPPVADPRTQIPAAARAALERLETSGLITVENVSFAPPRSLLVQVSELDSDVEVPLA